jgi:hypothetical protein
MNDAGGNNLLAGGPLVWLGLLPGDALLGSRSDVGADDGELHPRVRSVVGFL